MVAISVKDVRNIYFFSLCLYSLSSKDFLASQGQMHLNASENFSISFHGERKKKVKR